MPTTYQRLLIETTPRVIETEDQYEGIANRVGELVSKGRKRSPEETQLMRLLGLLIQDYDRRYALPPDHSTPTERLRFLVEHSDKPATELLAPIFGQRSHVHEALNGKRAISAAQARKLGKLFNIDAGLFL
jgi:HTH-type transcriptional regulator/antitoxin HigA